MANGPLFGIWHIDGHGYRWQQLQIDNGLPMEASIRMPPSIDRNGAGYVNILNTNIADLSKLNGKDIVLRMNNIGPEIDKTIPRVSPLTEANWRTSHMCVRIHPTTGLMDDTPVVSPFAGTTAWTIVGALWATSLWMKRLQEIIPNPKGVILRENNEGGRVSFNQLYEKIRPKILNHNNILVWSEAADNPSTFRDHSGNFLGPEWFIRLVGNLWYAERWQSNTILDGIDLRAKEWVDQRRSTYPEDCLTAFTAMENAQYKALYEAFTNNCIAAWKGKLRTCGYGGWDENRQNDAASPAMYLGSYRDPDLTNPTAYAINRFDAGTEELIAETANPKSWREYSISYLASALYAGAKNGKHAVVDPQSYAGLMTYIAWRLQKAGKEVRFTQWDNYNTKPTHLVFASTTNGTVINQVHIDALNLIGRSDMLSLTIENYEMAVLNAFNKIWDTSFLSKFYNEGNTIELISPLNTSTSKKIYSTETKVTGVNYSLVYVYSPCDLTVPVTVGQYTLPTGFNRSGYYLVNLTTNTIMTLESQEAQIIMLQQKIDDLLAINAQQAQGLNELGAEVTVLEQQVTTLQADKTALQADKTALSNKISSALALINQAKQALE